MNVTVVMRVLVSFSDSVFLTFGLCHCVFVLACSCFFIISFSNVTLWIGGGSRVDNTRMNSSQ